MRVRIVCYEDVNEWILGKFALKLQEHLRRRGVQADIAKSSDPSANVCHHIAFWGYERKVAPVETLMITHLDTDLKLSRLRYQLLTADMGVCMSTDTARKLIHRGFPEEKLCFVNPAHDGVVQPRKTVIGITSRLYEDLRKREGMLVSLISSLNPMDFAFHIMGAGWGRIVEKIRSCGIEVNYFEHFDYSAYVQLIQGLDYYLYLGQDEGSMGFLDASAAGIPSIVTPQGYHLDAPEGIAYSFNDLEELRDVFNDIASRKRRRIYSVSQWTWARYTEQHLKLWESLLLGTSVPSALRVPLESKPLTLFREAASDGAPIEHPHRMRVMMVIHGSENTAKGGPSIRAPQTASHLEKLGISVTLSTSSRPDPTGYDIVHVFNVWPPDSALSVLRHLKQFEVPIVFSPIYLELSEYAWAYPAIFGIFTKFTDDQEFSQALHLMARNELLVNGKLRTEKQQEIIPGYTGMVREMIGLSDRVICLSNTEKDSLRERSIPLPVSSLVHNAADCGVFAQGSPTLFADTYGVHNYVLCVGRVEVRKNQLLLLEALKEANIPVVLIGHALDNNYASLVRRYTKNLIWIDRLPHGEMLASAYRGAKVFALPSWSEGAPLSALEAAAAGTPLVLSNRSSEREYFGDLATYCDPASVDSIREAILHEYNSYSGQEERTRKLQKLVASSYTWERTAHDTLKAYLASLAEWKTKATPDERAVSVPVPKRVFDVTECEADINIQPVEVITWAPVWMTRSERLMLYSLIYSLRPDRYIEIGVYKGGSSLIVGAALDALGAPGKMYCVDIDRQVSQEHWNRVKHRAELVIGASPDILPTVAQMAGGTFDFALIDGDHRYESVIRDACGLVPYIDDGGHILFHDAYNSSVRKAIEEFIHLNGTEFTDLGFLTREITRGTSQDGSRQNWGGLRLLQKRRKKSPHQLPEIIVEEPGRPPKYASVADFQPIVSQDHVPARDGYPGSSMQVSETAPSATVTMPSFAVDLNRWETTLAPFIERKDGKFIHFLASILPLKLSTENLTHFVGLMQELPPFYFHAGGVGDALLLMSTFYDDQPAKSILTVPTSVKTICSFFEVFPSLRNIFVIPYPELEMRRFILRRLLSQINNCLGSGVTPRSRYYDEEWNDSLDIYEKYGIKRNPRWALGFKTDKLESFQLTVSPKGSTYGMADNRRNVIHPGYWKPLLDTFRSNGMRPIILGTPEERIEYPADQHCIDKRSYSFQEQMNLIASSDIHIGADTWGKTFAALAGVPAIVFQSVRGEDLQEWQDHTERVFINPWKEITLVKDLAEFQTAFTAFLRESPNLFSQPSAPIP